MSEKVRIRRAPKLGVFLVIGAFVGFLVTLILTSLYPADPSVGFVALMLMPHSQPDSCVWVFVAVQ